MLQKEDAHSIASARKEAHIKGRLVELINEVCKKIRENANQGYFSTQIVLSDYKFHSEISSELCQILEKSGYELSITHGLNGLGDIVTTVIQIKWT